MGVNVSESVYRRHNTKPTLRKWSFKRRYLQQNALSHLDGLEHVPGLETLNISRNALSSLDGLQHCCALKTLLCSQNKLTGHDCLGALTQCKALSTVDLQDNDLDADAVRLLQCVATIHSGAVHAVFPVN